MNPEFEKCLKHGKIKEFSEGKNLVKKELQTAEVDLKDGKEGFDRKKYKWATIQSYYSMFHSARALLYAKNYREKSHYCLIVALTHLYVNTKELPACFVEALQKGKNLREDADYYNEWSEIGAKQMLDSAEKFLNKVKEIIAKPQT